MQLDVAVDLLTKASTSLTNYRRTGFAQASTKDMCEEMNVEAVLKEKILRSTKKPFAYEVPDEPIAHAMTRLEATFFNVVVDTAIESLTDRFKTLGEVRDRFGVLLNFQKLDDQALSNQCDNLCMTLSTGNESDIDGKELAVEVKNFPRIPSDDMTALELVTFIHKKTFLGTVSQSVGCPENRPHSACDCGLSREELLKAEAHQDLSKVFHGTGSTHWSCNN
ncbi:uncharacterized protein [Macrobrachium rosenbergii]|uniref:uncharacterized protein n=1 Tax=Macrobrachium rosenbergii TaxID=79674 RepID=UPI0034D63A8A